MTLVDTSQELVIAISSVWSEYGWDISIDTDPREFMKIYYREKLPRPSDPMARWYFWRSVWMKYLENRRYGKPMPCSDSLLLASSGRYVTAIVTGREVKAEMFMEELQSYGFPTELIRVYSTGDLWPGATKRDLYEYLANIYAQLGISREEVVVISDSPRDIRFIREAGFKAVGYIPFRDPEVISMIESESTGIAIDTLCIDHIL
ncbi:MAG: HAD hydrolase-like protein [Sulfolobales archaeon]